MAVALAFLAMGCTAITDFDKPKDAGVDGGTLYSIHANLTDIVTVTLMGTAGELTLQLTNPLPTADDATLIALLTEGTVALNVTNEETNVNFNLVEGQYNDSISLPGDYNMSLNPERTALTINFFNEVGADGSTLHSGGDYMATITVSQNAYFVVETFTRDVTVTGS
jgi:hypothetical protein